MQKTKNFKIVIVCFASILLSVAAGAAQTASPTPTEEETRLDNEIKILKKEKEKLELEKAIRGMNVPTDVTPLKGEQTGAKDMFIEVEMQTYRAVAAASNQIACVVKTTKPNAKNIILFKPDDYSVWRDYRLNYSVINSQLGYFASRYDALFAEFVPQAVKANGQESVDGSPLVAASTVMSSIGGVIKSAIGLASFFRTDLEFSTKSVEVNDLAFRSALMNSLRSVYASGSSQTCASSYVNTNLKIFDPSVFSPFEIKANGDIHSPTLEQVKNLYEKKARADAAVRTFDKYVLELEAAKKAESDAQEALTKFKVTIKTAPQNITELQAEIRRTKDPVKRAELIKARNDARTALATAQEKVTNAQSEYDKAKAKKAALEKEIEDVKPKITALRLINDDFTSFINTFTRSDANGPSPLSRYVRGEGLHNYVKDDNTFWLQVNAVKAGGSNRVKKNLVRYFTGVDITHNGGFIAEYILGDRRGEIIRSNFVTDYQNYVHAKDLRKQKP